MTSFSQRNEKPSVKQVTSVDADVPYKVTVATTKKSGMASQTFRLPETEEPRFLEQVQLFVDEAAQYCNVKPDLLKYIMACDHVLRFQIPVIRDNGVLETFTCYRAQHKHHFMPVKGGLKYDSTLTLQETVAQASLMTFKLTCA
jgi:glutamate dehydrogenase (NAD(P)+)